MNTLLQYFYILLIKLHTLTCDFKAQRTSEKTFHLYQHTKISTMRDLARFRHGGNNMADMGNRWEGMQFVNTSISICFDSLSI